MVTSSGSPAHPSQPRPDAATPHPTSALWVHAHPDPMSLTSRLATTGVDTLRAHGARVAVTDLYARRFDPVLSEAEFVGPAPAESTFSARQNAATRLGTLPADVRGEQEKLLDADLLVVSFPLWWYGMPAILKGWFDRVFSDGVGFGVRDENGKLRKYGDGGFTGKTLLPIVTAGDRATALGDRGISGSIHDLLWPLSHGIGHYTGMRSLPPHLVASSNHTTAATYRAENDRLRARIAGWAEETPIGYRALCGGDYDPDHVLRPDTAVGATGFDAHRVDDGHRGERGWPVSR